MNAELMTVGEIADETGITRAGVRQRLRMGHVRPSGKRGYSALYGATDYLLAPNAARRSERVVEDATWMVDNGVGLTEATHRLGYTKSASLERLLYRAGCGDVFLRLKAIDARVARRVAA